MTLVSLFFWADLIVH